MCLYIMSRGPRDPCINMSLIHELISIHIHVQVHTDWTIRANGTVASSTTVSTGQVFINETLSAQLMALEPYASHTTINPDDQRH